MASDWDKLSNEVSGDTVIVDVDCTIQKNLCQTQGIRGYPTIKYWKAGQAAQDYKGGRDFNSLLKHVQENLA